MTAKPKKMPKPRPELPARSPSKPSWINVQDFSEIVFWLQVDNPTTKTRVKGSEQVQITEIYSDGLSLRVPKSLCSIGHQLTLQVSIKQSNPLQEKTSNRLERKLVTTAKVTEAEILDERFQVVTIRFYQPDQEPWKKLLTICQERQNKVTNILKERQG